MTTNHNSAIPNNSNHSDVKSGKSKRNVRRENQTWSTNKGYIQRLISKLRSNKEFRRQYFTAASLLWAYVMLGWSLAQMGPSFLDLQIISGTTLEEGSLYFTVYAVGMLVGSLVTGIVYDKFVYDKSLVIFLTQLMNAVLLAAIPWCTKYEVMLFAHVIKGFFGGGFETGGNAYLMHICGNKNAALMQALYFAFGIGGIISPYAISPFLAEEADLKNALENVTDYENMTSLNVLNSNISSRQQVGLNVDVLRNISEQQQIDVQSNATIDFAPESRLYIGYAITAFLTLTSAIPFGIFFVNSKFKRESKSTSSEETKQSAGRPLSITLVLLVIMSSIMALYCGMEDSFSQFLAAFCVKHMHWTKVDAALLTSVFWASISAGRFVAIFSIHRFKPSRTSCALCSLFLISHIALLMTSQFKYDVGVWITVVILGLSSSVIFPLLFTWMEEDVAPLTGRISSILMISASVGSAVDPIILGMTMDNYTPMTFSYTLVVETGLTTLLCFCILLITLNTTKPNKRHENIEIHINHTFQDDVLPGDKTIHDNQQNVANSLNSIQTLQY